MRFRRVCLSALAVLGAAGSAVPTPAVAQGDTLAQRQARIDEILGRMPLPRVIARRQMCASGISGEMDAAIERALGTRSPNRLAEECLASFTRVAREGRTEPVRIDRATTALALDQGFMNGFRQAGPVPAGLPRMPELKAVAERCLAQREPNARLCSAAGFGLGMRAARDEIVTAG